MQEGIFYQQGSSPGKHWGLLFLRVRNDINSETVYNELNHLWGILQNLKIGKIQDLPKINLPVPLTGLQITIGYGKNIFSKKGIKKNLPSDFIQANFRSPLATGGGKLLLASGLSYSNAISKNPATEDIALQFISDSELLTYRCYQELYKVIASESNNLEYPFEMVKFYTGFQREDKRSWIDFHDGISNLKSGAERLDAIKIKENNIPDERWINGGTFLAFMRIEVNIDTWLKLDRTNQELLVGRDKVSGCPFENVVDGKPVTVNKCPFTNTTSIIDKDSNGNFINHEFFETPQTADNVILSSHVQRANHHREPISHRDSLRIFRQGYEFFEVSDASPKVKLGLNFVSFQDTPERLIRLLTQNTWLGNINFGGTDDNQTEKNNLLKIWGAGIYIVPPSNDVNKIPGYELFEG
jgi:Dyp-type peroxidase family